MSKKLSKRTRQKLETLLRNTGDMALRRRAKRIIEELNPQDGDKILDVGCGNGYYLYILVNLGLKIDLTGVDFDKRALESAKDNLKGKKVGLLHGDLMEGLPFKSSSFDKAVMSEVVEHLLNNVKGLKEVRRILKNDGILVLSVPNANYPFLWDPINWVLERFFGTHIKSGFWAGIWNQHLRLYKPQEIRHLVRKSGLKIKKVKILSRWCLPFNHYIVNLGARLLAEKKGPTSLITGANKFSQSRNKSKFVKAFFTFSNLLDLLNNFWVSNKVGVSIVAVAENTRKKT